MDKDDNNNKIVWFENDNYKVVTGKSMLVEDMVVYVAINKTTQIVEAEEQMLPRIVDYAMQLDSKIKELEMEGIILSPLSSKEEDNKKRLN